MSQINLSLRRGLKYMILGVLIFAACLVGSSMKTYAATTVAEGTSRYGMAWTLDSDGVLTIGGSTTEGEAVISYRDAWYQYRDSVKKVVAESGVTALADSAFSSYENLTSVTLPSTVTSIGDSAFNYCENLTSVSMSSGVTLIDDHAFNMCSSLKSITIPSTVKTIGDYAQAAAMKR